MNKSRNVISILIILAACFLVSCEMLGLSGDDAEKDKKKVEKKIEKKSCRPTKLKINNEVERTVLLTYSGKNVSVAETKIRFSNVNMDMDNIHKYDSIRTVNVKYEYDTAGQLLRLITLPDSSVTSYSYDDKGRILKITSFPVSQQFDYDDKGRITKQSTFVDNKLRLYSQYEYNEKNQPIACHRFDEKDERITSAEFVYDDKINPLKNLSAKINIAELMYGYPVGNYEHNPIKVTTTYHTKSKWKIHGVFKNPGDTDVVNIKYEYNADDYPVSYCAITDTIDLEYSCE